MDFAAPLFELSMYGLYSKNGSRCPKYKDQGHEHKKLRTRSQCRHQKEQALSILFAKKQQKTYLPGKIYL